MKITFKTKIFHPNIHKDGYVSLQSISYGWTPQATTRVILEEIYALLITPDANNTLHLEAADMHINKREEFDKMAKEYTNTHAMN